MAACAVRHASRGTVLRPRATRGLLLSLLSLLLCSVAEGGHVHQETCDSVQVRCDIAAARQRPAAKCGDMCSSLFTACKAACNNDSSTVPAEHGDACDTAIILFDNKELALCEPRICEEGGEGLFLPLFSSEWSWPAGIRAVLYCLGLLWFFAGVALISDVFMGAIEVITSKQTRIEIKEQVYHVRVWNDTVANLTLMALGSSAPEILLSVVELMGGDYYSGQLGPSTIVGSAAFNLMIICGVCVIAIPGGAVRKIQHTHVYAVTAFFSVFAYIWLFAVLTVITPNVVTIGEAIITLLMFPLLVGLAWGMETGKFDRCFGWGKNVSVRPSGVGGGGPGRVRQIQIPGGGPDAVVDPKLLAEIIKGIREEKPTISDDEAGQMAMWKALHQQPKSRAYYRVQATRSLTAGAQVGVKPPHSQSLKAEGPRSNQSTSESKLGDPSSASDIKTEHLGFENISMSVYEDDKQMEVKVIRYGKCKGTQKVRYFTKDVTAEQGKDYDKSEGILTFADGEREKTIKVGLIEDNHYEEDETFEICLADAEPAIQFSPDKMVVTIINVDFPGVFIFSKQHYKVCESEKKVLLTVKRIEGCSGDISCDYECKEETAMAGADFKAVSGTLNFSTGVLEQTIEIEIVDDNAYEKDETFQVLLSNPSGGARFPVTTDGGEENEISVVTIISDEGQRRLVDNVMALMNINKDRIRLGRANWGDQFYQAVHVMGGDPDLTPSRYDYGIHFVCLPWKVIFAIVPPTDFAGGWLCFCISLTMIGVVTAFIGDLASLFGCVLNVNDSITAITFVALGTSLPDTFASKTAAVQDAYADASIGNVTGSNSVNVFLGLGLPWLIGALYWGNQGASTKWYALYGTGDIGTSLKDGGFMTAAGVATSGVFVVPGGDLGFSVIVFSTCACATLTVLLLRRMKFGGELGGPSGPMWGTFGLFVTLWLTYIFLSIAKDNKWL